MNATLEAECMDDSRTAAAGSDMTLEGAGRPAAAAAAAVAVPRICSSGTGAMKSQHAMMRALPRHAGHRSWSSGVAIRKSCQQLMWKMCRHAVRQTRSPAWNSRRQIAHIKSLPSKSSIRSSGGFGGSGGCRPRTEMLSDGAMEGVEGGASLPLPLPFARMFSP